MAHLPPRTTLEQWAALRAVVERGSFEAAAEALHRSQSSVSYALRRLQQQLPVAVLKTRGRKAELTPAGAVLLRRASALLDAAAGLEQLAATLAQGWETEVRLAVEIVCPPELLLCSLAEFSARAPQTRVQVIESVLAGTGEALLQRQADLAVTGQVPPGFLGDPLVAVEFVAVAHRDHPLHALGRELTEDDLRGQRQVVIRDTGVHRRVDSGWLGAEQRWTVSHLRTAIATIRRGLAFAWVPVAHVADELASGELVPLPLRAGRSYRGTLYLVYGDRDGAGPATRALAEVLATQARRLARSWSG
jgi:DNA-binding transcriptional LysR family regulator